MKIGLIGCVQSSLVALESLIGISDSGIQVVAVVTKKKSSFNADHVDLASTCIEHAIPFHYEKKNEKQRSLDFMSEFKPDIIYCIGWSYLLGDNFLTLAPLGAIGFHPAKLPQNRGRHPIIWALVLGLSSTASTFFRMDLSADSGPIISQVDISISNSDNAASLYEKILHEMKRQIPDFTHQLNQKKAIFVEQDHNASNTWRKRSRTDGLIDWRMQAEDIYNLVRALSRPYPGAEFQNSGSYTLVWESVVSDKIFSRNIEPGYVLVVNKNSFTIKCGGESAITILGIESGHLPNVGDYL